MIMSELCWDDWSMYGGYHGVQDLGRGKHGMGHFWVFG